MKKNGGAPSARGGAMGMPLEVRSRESHDTAARVQTLKWRWWSLRLLPEVKTRQGMAPRRLSLEAVMGKSSSWGAPRVPL
jgi:hypothetical protein